MTQQRPENQEIADVLGRVADLLRAQDANQFRVRAYRRAARSVETCEQPVANLAQHEDDERLEMLPDIGKSIAASIREFVCTGRLAMLERLEGNISPEDLLATVPGLGPTLAERIHSELSIDTLEQLELAAHEGRLSSVRGISEGRVRVIRDSLAAILSQSARRRARRRRDDERRSAARPISPSVRVILDVDREYRSRSDAGQLKKIAPRRFNPEGEAWLPILHAERGEWQFTAMYSNTSRAHELGRTRDWVVIYCERHGEEDQCTVVTEYQGPLRGERVIRGRERECRQYYSRLTASGGGDKRSLPARPSASTSPRSPAAGPTTGGAR